MLNLTDEEIEELGDEKLLEIAADEKETAINRMIAWLHNSDRGDCVGVMHRVVEEFFALKAERDQLLEERDKLREINQDLIMFDVEQEEAFNGLLEGGLIAVRFKGGVPHFHLTEAGRKVGSLLMYGDLDDRSNGELVQ